ncbi:hypothetical protein EPUS_06304 [Endocarpon pusillum Z07020]|uniref:C2H2-type domain-containing protein n=1 Tax=Endocarpon pusillum (strain Z07020 / HMAS-L-300199) TaxID=1263415 RepID=U1GY71_ENDPU|nr:uncharacterized protein EPUS_06304 [Endocarpon pusillum Z07020]ERF77086.1 hypothetical protein EPUS_06304 [Endocarpon pusillum Z07020]
MTFSNLLRHNVRDANEKTNCTNGQRLRKSSSCSSQASCGFCEFIEASRWESGPNDPSTPKSASACTLCTNEDTASRTYPSPSKKRKILPPPVCIDPDCSEVTCKECPESVCDECSNHEESCEECVPHCVSDCVSDCRISLCGDRPESSLHDDYPFDNSYFELFGDQATQMFDLDGSIPQLPVNTLPTTFDDLGLCCGNPTASTPASVGAFENSISSYGEPEHPRVAMQVQRQYRALDPAQSTFLDNMSVPAPAPAFTDGWTPSSAVNTGGAADGAASALVSSSSASLNNEQIEAGVSNISSKHDNISVRNSVHSFQAKTMVTAPKNSALPQNSTLIPNQASNRPFRPSAPCQWTDPGGQSCGKVFELGSDLHEHLKTAHNVNREVFCLWRGCRVGALGSTPHKYANSVERHTWGHSGYRPYKCATCSEGFAAANVRDEHIANIHQKRKMFSCDICSHQCTSARNLKRHKDDTHKDERFQCEFCNRNGKIRLFPRGSNLARHFRKCKHVLALFPNAAGAAAGKIEDDWFPTGYRGGHQGMDKAKIVPPQYLPLS